MALSTAPEIVIVRVLGLVTLLLMAASCSPRVDVAPPLEGTRPAAREPIFRWVHVARGTITLGEPLAPAIDRAAPSDTVVVLPAGSFAGAERIYVHLTRSGTVRALTFDYARGADFEGMVADYSSSLGPPERSRPARAGEEPTDVAAWRDERTEFRLVRDPNRSAWTVRSVLLDRALANATR